MLSVGRRSVVSAAAIDPASTGNWSPIRRNANVQLHTGSPPEHNELRINSNERTSN